MNKKRIAATRVFHQSRNASKTAFIEWASGSAIMSTKVFAIYISGWIIHIDDNW